MTTDLQDELVAAIEAAQEMNRRYCAFLKERHLVSNLRAQDYDRLSDIGKQLDTALRHAKDRQGTGPEAPQSQ